MAMNKKKKEKKHKKHKGLEIEIEIGKHHHKEKKDGGKKKPSMKSKVDKDLQEQRSSNLKPNPKQGKIVKNQGKCLEVPFDMTNEYKKKKK